MNLREIGIGKAFVFQREGVTIREINESTSFSNKTFTTLKSQYGQRGLVYDIDETWIFFIGADTKYYKIENNETNKEAIVVVETLEEAKSLGSNDLPPKEESLFRKAQEVVSVQPMTAPVGVLFYLDYQYNNSVSIEQIQNDNK